MIEAVTYRAAPHATADDPAAYIDLERVEEEKQRECVGRYEAYLRRLGLLSDEAAEAVRADAAGCCATGSPRPRPSRPPIRRSSSSTPTWIRRPRSRPISPSCGGSLAELTLVEAVNDAFHVELERDPDVMVMGEDVGRAGGVFRATAGLRDRFGADRCVDTPLAEAGILGSAVGLCMAGWRPVCEMQYDAFSYPCLDQLITHVGPLPLAHRRRRWSSRSSVRMPYGGGVRAPELHDDSPEAYYVHTPGVKVAIPSTPADAKGLLAAAIRDPDPVVVLEPKLHYRTMRGEVPEGEHVVAARGRPHSRARARPDLRGVRVDGAAGASRPRTLLDGEAVEVLDIRSLKPLDEDALLAAAAKTGRVVIIQEAPRSPATAPSSRRSSPRRRSSTCRRRSCA